MTGEAASPPAHLQEGEYVADLLPATAPAPEPARRINFLKAFLLYWLVPQRFGPHLAVGSFRRAIFAHLLALFLAALVIAVPFLPFLPLVIDVAPDDLVFEWSFQGIRVSAAYFVLGLAAESATGRSWDWVWPLTVLGALPLAQIAILLIATAVMPWCAGGDRAGSVWKRSVKNVYWSTTIVIPAAVIVAAMGLGVWYGVEWPQDETLAILLALAPLPVVAVLVLRMWLTGAKRYVGEPAGPAFAPREPRCDDCGYTLIRLPVDSNCPECGLPIRDSLPGGRRRPTVWQQRELSARGFLDLIRLQWVIVRNPEFFKRLPVHSGLPAARHFWWGTYLLVVVTVLALLNVAYHLAPQHGDFDLAPVALMAVAVPFVLQSAVMFILCLYAQMRCDVRDYRVSAVVCYHAAPLMWPLVFCLLTAGIILASPAGSALDQQIIYVTRSSANITMAHTVLLLLALAALAGLWFWVWRVMFALQGVRHANV